MIYFNSCLDCILMLRSCGQPQVGSKEICDSETENFNLKLYDCAWQLAHMLTITVDPHFLPQLAVTLQIL